MFFKSALATVTGVCLLFGCPFSGLCWEDAVPQNVVGFDFEVTSVVEGPDAAGIYSYTYTIYRYDQGLARYKDVSHISFWFPCKIAAQKSILNGQFGIQMTCTGGGCPVLEMGETRGMTEPVLAPECCFFWGFKFDECGNADGRFLLPNVDEISYPRDSSDPHCTIVFRSSAEPERGKWLIKGGGGRNGLYDAGHVQVPTCACAVSIDDVSWGTVKALYR